MRICATAPSWVVEISDMNKIKLDKTTSLI
jgi:hypothetical protein